MHGSCCCRRSPSAPRPAVRPKHAPRTAPGHAAHRTKSTPSGRLRRRSWMTGRRSCATRTARWRRWRSGTRSKSRSVRAGSGHARWSAKSVFLSLSIGGLCWFDRGIGGLVCRWLLLLFLAHTLVCARARARTPWRCSGAQPPRPHRLGLPRWPLPFALCPHRCTSRR